MKLISWNVNGIRSVLGKGFPDFMSSADADILCLQETKARPEQVAATFPGYEVFWNPADRPGYSGTATLTKVRPLSVFNGIGVAEHDAEGRVLTTEFENFYLVNIYVPNSKRELSRLDYRVKSWGPALRVFLKTLEQKKPVIFCGDLNVAHREIDIARPKENVKNAGFTPEEREDFGLTLDAGFIDTFREFESGNGHYTWWSYMGTARARNIGWRIDYFCISPALRPALKSAFILPHIMGSDHCPVGIELE